MVCLCIIQANVLVDVHGNPQLCDFGLSRIHHEITHIYDRDPIGGSLRHTAPELLGGKDHSSTPQSDVFSLAVTNYELGTQSPPFSERNALAAAQLMQNGTRPKQPPSLGGLGPSATAHLWTLLDRMWEHEPQLRPPALSACTSLLLIDRERNSSRAADMTSTLDSDASESSPLEAAETSIAIAWLASTHISTPSSSKRTRLSGAPLPNLTDAIPGTSEEQSRKWSTRCETLSHTDKVVSVTYDLNRNEFASGSNNICIWTRNSQGTGWLPRYNWGISQVTSLSYSNDGALLAAGSYHDIKLWDTNTGESKGSLKGHKKFVTTLASSPTNYMMASGSKDKIILLWDPRMKTKIGSSLAGHTGAVSSVAFSPDGEVVASASSDTTVRLWDLKAGRCIRQLSGFVDKVTAVSISPNGRYITAASDDSTIRRWNYKTLDEIGIPLQGHQGPIKCLAFSPDSTQIASGSVDMVVRMWDASTGTGVGLPLEGHRGTVESIAFSPNGDQMVSGSRDKTVKVWYTER